MKKISHISTDFKITTTVTIGKKLMTVSVGELASADFHHENFHSIITDVADPLVLSTVLDFERVSVWEMPLDEAGILDSICDYFKANDFEVLAEFLDEKKPEILAEGMPSLCEQWDRGLPELLLKQAAKTGKIHTARQEKNFDVVLRKAGMLRHGTARHPLAKHFISNVWPVIYEEMRSKLISEKEEYAYF